MTVLTTRFSPTRPPSYAIGRHGELIVVQGGGIRPLRWIGSGAATDAGVDAPTAAPGIAISPTAKYYVARCDVYKGGEVYYAPPEVTFSAAGSTPPTRPAKASSFLSSASVREIRVIDGGKGYASTPTASLSSTFGSGAQFEAVLDTPDEGPDDPANSRRTGITDWEIVQGPPFEDEQDVDIAYKTKWQAMGPVTIDVNGNGSGVVSRTVSYSAGGLSPCGTPIAAQVAINVPYTITGITAGSGAQVRIGFAGHVYPYLTGCSAPVYSVAGCTDNCRVEFLYSWYVTGVSVIRYGAGFADNDIITLTLPAGGYYDTTTSPFTWVTPAPASKSLILRGYSGNNPLNRSSERYAVKTVRIKDGNRGSGYVVAPQIKISSASGFGAYATCTVRDGAIDTVTLENGGGGYKAPPTVEAVAGGAEAFAVARPHLRGLYQCYYRYVDATPEDRGGPVPSNLSPLFEADCGEGTSQITWTFARPTGRQAKVELWRSTSNEATTLYRVTADAGTGTTFVDDLTDEELRDADRPAYAAMPVVMPNGDLNANRFGIPPSGKAVVVTFQDRMWYGVDTSGTEPNTLYFSEVDEPESVPDINQLVIQQNVQSSDAVTALIPFGSTLLVMQGRHSYALTYVRKPLVDAQVSLIAHRGCLTQRCWDIYDGVAYVMDQYGVYSITPSGEVRPLSDAITDYWRSRIDFSSTAWFMLRFDPALGVLRCFVACKGDGGGLHATRCLTYSPLTGAWWEERYPQRLSGAATITLNNGDYRSIYGGAGGVYVLGDGAVDAARGMVLSVRVTDSGAGYLTPPTATVAGGTGAVLEPSLNGETGVSSIWIKNGGFGYASGTVTISPPNDPTHPAPRQATATFVASPLDRDTPVAPSYSYRSGNIEFADDVSSPSGGSQSSRDVRVLYAPQPAPCTVSLRSYYNNAKYPRRNAALRDRGTGFVHSDVEPAARLDMSEYVRKYGATSGMAQALFAGRTIEDIQAADRHVAIGLDGARRTPEPVIFYGVEVDGSKDA